MVVIRAVPRLVLGYIIALPIIVPFVARTAPTLYSYSLAVTMSSSAPGHLQVFYDSGAGFSEPRSTTATLVESGKPHRYRLRLPPGRYRRLRIDPGTLGARYEIKRASILAPDGTVFVGIPLDAFVPAGGTTITERTGEHVVVEPAVGPADPQLEYVPEGPVVIPRVILNPRVLDFVARLAAYWFVGIAVVWLFERATSPLQSGLLRGLARTTRAARRHPGVAVWLVAIVASGAATYPVWLLGRSLVSPNNFGVPLLYDWVPYTPGSNDLTIEDVRGSDVAATLLQTIPHSRIQRGALLAGEMPLWNRYNASGRPLWGQGLTFLGDPLHWLTLVTPDPSLGWDLKLLAHRLVFSAGVGFVALAATGAWLPAVIVSAAAPFAGIYLYRLSHPAAFVLTYASWVLLGWMQLSVAVTRERRTRALVLVAVSSSLVLFASTPKEAAVTLLGLEATGAALLLVSRGSWIDRRRRCLAGAAAVVIAGLITMPHWLVFFHTLRESFTAYDVPAASFAGRSHAVGYFLGSFAAGPVQPGLHLLALVLAAAVIVAAVRVFRRSAAAACGLAAAVLFAIAFGAIPASWIVHLPLVGNIGHIHDVFLTAALPLVLVVLAAGAGSLMANSERRAMAVSALVALALWWLLANLWLLARDDGFEKWGVLLIAPLAVAVPVCCALIRVNSHRLQAVAATGLAGGILLLPGGLQANTGIVALDQLLIQPRPRTVVTQTSAAVDAVQHFSPEPSRAVGVDMVLFSGSQALYELEGLGGADPLEVRFYRELVDASGIFRSMVWFTMVTPPDVPRLAPLLDMLNVSFLLEQRDVVVPGVIEVPLSSPDRLKVARRSTAWPRAFFVESLTTYRDPQELLRKVAVAGRPFAAIQAGDREVTDAIKGIPIDNTARSSAPARPAHDYKMACNTTSFFVSTSGPGVVVLTETYLARDFRATLNGRRVPYFRVNHAFKALAIPSSGEWKVEFEYRPHHWGVSLVMSGFGVLLLAGLCLSIARAGSRP